MAKFELLTRLKGPLQNIEDWWWLLVDDDTGEMAVEHEWAHTDIGDFANPRNGEKRYTVAGFLASDQPQSAKDRLGEVLKELS